ncbi:hypothetical protein A6A04_13550 [Paramagnetospirillum marisnigri]|uniref:Glycosyltransferase RgtA/B/C/D-like domain-containing protein n=1 Tax=Paramagnetospirillum marisnigri TaxID=1285242 RepID=A0A178MV93_9PROT|nr:DUF2029 domain-containing protein [Paramagnetospirillum marisnigri]OAN53911.1 hypothetical protein A6A04_13550 [Paramagnetospirillum marisnigri]
MIKSGQPDAASGQRSYRLTVLGLGGLAALLLAYPLARMAFTFEIDNTEGWNAYHQLRALAGQSLYDGGSPYFFNNYPPLSFYLVGWLSALLGDVVMVGRWVSLLAFAAICLSVASVVRSGGGSRLDALFGAVTCVGLFSTLGVDYVGKDNPQFLGLALMSLGLAVHLAGPPGARRAVVTAGLFALGVMTKHSVVCIPLLVSLDVLIRGNARSRAAYLASGAVLAGLAFAVVWGLAGPAFFTQLLARRTWEEARAFLFTIEVLGQVQAAMAVVGLALLHARKQRPARLVLAQLGIAWVLAIFFSGGAGTDINVFFDVLVALSMGAGLAPHLVGIPRARAALALAIHAGIIFYSPFCLGRLGVELLGDMDEREKMFAEDVAYVAAIPGTALCHSHLVCLRAGKPAFYDPVNMMQAMTFGRLPTDTLTGMLERQEIAVVQITDPPPHPEDDIPGTRGIPARYVDFQPEAFEALRQHYVLDRVGASGRFYRPRR